MTFDLMPYDDDIYKIAADHAEENGCLLPQAIRDKVLPLDIEKGNGKGDGSYSSGAAFGTGIGDGRGAGYGWALGRGNIGQGNACYGDLTMRLTSRIGMGRGSWNESLEFVFNEIQSYPLGW